MRLLPLALRLEQPGEDLPDDASELLALAD
jgi:hypothetical protein